MPSLPHARARARRNALLLGEGPGHGRYPRGRCLYKLLHDISFIRDNDGVMAGWGEFRCGAVREGRE